MSVTLDSKTPDGPMADKWETYKEDAKLVNPANKRKYRILGVGPGLAGAAAAATLGAPC
jgi:succinate dehydrogenase / fumarate reductase flavoprotein subunit